MGQHSRERGGLPAKPARWTLPVLVLVAFALRVYNLGGLEFRFDEAISANVSGLGWEGALSHLRLQPFEHPPVYYLSLYAWRTVVGRSEFALRFFSVFWGTLVLPLFYLLIRRLANERLARLTALLAAISPFLVAYSQEARMYTLLPCLALGALLAYRNALRRASKPGWWLVYALLVGVGVATHYYFVLIWVVTTLFLLLERPRRRSVWLWGITVQALAVLAVVIWLMISPGTRDSLMRVMQGETAFPLLYKLDKVMPTLMLSEADAGDLPVVTYVLTVAGWLLAMLGLWWAKRGAVLSRQCWRLLTILLVLPLTLSLIIPYGVLGRHLGYTLVSVIPFTAVGLLFLQRWGRVWLAIGAFVVLALSCYGLIAHYTASPGDLGRAMEYIDEHGRVGDLLVLTQPAQKPLLDYYNDEGWPVQYVPADDSPLTPTQVDEALSAVSQGRSRLWLGPVGAWTADPDAYVDRWLAANAFQAQKVWFPDSSTVALYYTAAEGLIPMQRMLRSWGGKIDLLAIHVGPLRVQAGDAVRLRLEWRADLDLDERYAINLALVDDEGRTWAQRRSEPCSGWCPTDGWEIDSIHYDHHALQIPVGTPPGEYSLQMVWTPLEGESPLPAEEAGRPTARITLAQITVAHLQGRSFAPKTVPNPLRASFGDEVALLGYDPATWQAKLGEILHLETHWRAETAPSGDLSLLLSLLDKRGQVVAEWRSMPSARFYPTSAWQAGEYVRGQHDLLLPSTLSPGEYRLRIRVVAPSGEVIVPSGEIPRRLLRAGGGQGLILVTVRLVDRARLFDFPEMEHEVQFRMGQHAYLMGYDLDESNAYPGGQVDVVLYWKAGGAMVRPFKVFTHLLGEDGATRAQHDAPPGGGCCPANTWSEGEAIVDAHAIFLSADIPQGTYRLAVGMYDEEENTRLPVYDASGQQLARDYAILAPVTVQPSLTGVPPTTPDQASIPSVMATPTQTAPPRATAAPRPDFDARYRFHLPLVLSRGG